ncbi:MAG: flagellar basal-body MS-ring/collar protein FliF [Chromatocurvus sp.]
MATNALVERFTDYSRQPAARQIALLVGLAASIALGFGLVQWAMTPNYKPLFGSLSGEDTNQVITALEANGIDYRMDNRSGTLAVASDQVHRARLLLASEGFPREDGLGFETLYQEQEIGVSSFMEQARYHRSLEQELSRTMTAMQGVRAARVHVAVSKQSAFLRQREQPAASVMLQLTPGRTLNARQLAGVIHLVASSVPNLQAEQVSVVDQQGRLLSGQGEQDGLGYTKEQYRLSQQLEQRYAQRIVGILEPILGPGNVRAEVTADIDFTRIERTSEQYAPETVIRSEQTTEETSDSRFAGGVPGTLANQPPAPPEVAQQPAGEEAEAADDQRPARVSRRATRNYEMDKTISHIRETPGGLSRLSVAVVVDYIDGVADDGAAAPVPLPPERIDEINALVREAVGFNTERGDTLSVINASFIDPPAMETPAPPSILEQDWIWRTGKGVLAVLVLGALVFFVLRPLIAFSTGAAPGQSDLRDITQGQRALGNDGGNDADGAGGLQDDQVTLASQQQYALPGGYQQQLQMARNLATGEPQRAAQVVKGWVADDG